MNSCLEPVNQDQDGHIHVYYKQMSINFKFLVCYLVIILFFFCHCSEGQQAETSNKKSSEVSFEERFNESLVSLIEETVTDRVVLLKNDADLLEIDRKNGVFIKIVRNNNALEYPYYCQIYETYAGVPLNAIPDESVKEMVNHRIACLPEKNSITSCHLEIEVKSPETILDTLTVRDYYYPMFSGDLRFYVKDSLLICLNDRDQGCFNPTYQHYDRQKRKTIFYRMESNRAMDNKIYNPIEKITYTYYEN